MKTLVKGLVVGAIALGSMSTIAHADSGELNATPTLNQSIVTTVATYRDGQLISLEFSYEFVDGRM